MNKPVIYMDYAATTPVDPRVLDTMLPYFGLRFGNAASRTHAYGWEAEEAVENARTQIARLLCVNSREIIFTSGATESNNLALKGAFAAYSSKGNHIITSAIEHKAILDVCRSLEKRGARVTYLPVDRAGHVDPDAVRSALTPSTILVSIMHANNEIGVIQDLAAIGMICKERGVIFHTDAAQSVGKIPFDAQSLGIDMASISGHKIYAPKGVGALYVRRKNPKVVLESQMDGGGHERGLRSGTLNVPGAVGLGKACEISRLEMHVDGERIRALRDRLLDGIVSRLKDVTLNGDLLHRLPGNLNLSFGYVEGESLVASLTGIAVSSGSACTSASLEPSHVLKALGISEELAHTSIRFSLGRFNTDDDVDVVSDRTVDAVDRLRALSPLYEMLREAKRYSEESDVAEDGPTG
jgi:cysteine desulfurase